MLNTIKRWGTGCGIEIRGDDLVVVAVKSRRDGVHVLGRLVIAGFRGREPGEWGAEYARFQEELGLRHVAATVCLPRQEVIVRNLQLPAMGRKEMAAAVALQLDTMHPYGDEDVYHAYSVVSAQKSRTGQVPLVVVLAEAAVINSYADQFAAAAIPVASFSVAAAALHTALRVRWDEPTTPLVVGDFRSDRLELYGEAAGRPAWSSAFDLATVPAGRAMQLAYSDLRLSEPASLVMAGEIDEVPDFPGFELKAVEELLPAPVKSPEEFRLRRDLSALAVALESACPYIGWGTNLLPTDRRESNSRLMYVPTAALLTLVCLMGLAFIARPLLQNAVYSSRLEAETNSFDRVVFQVERNRKETGDARVKLEQLQILQTRTETDMRIMSELSNRIPDTIWLDNLEVNDAGIQMQGIAPEAAPLLAVINESSTVSGAKFSRSLAVVEDGERFQIMAERRAMNLPALEVLLAAAPAAANTAQPSVVPADPEPTPEEPESETVAPEPAAKPENEPQAVEQQ